MLADDLFDEAADGCLVTGVGLFVRALADVGADYGRPVLAEQFYAGLSDPRRSASDDRDLALKSIAHALPIAAAPRL